MDKRRTSKFLSLVLRHRPERVGIDLDANGWADVAALLEGMRAAGHPLTRSALAEIVASDAKGRYAFNADGSQIRAVQGHSRAVDLQLDPATPPDLLYHGTVDRFLPSIRERGLLPGTRQHVHLSADRDTATQVGRRRGSPVVLTIDAAAMSAAGHRFHVSANGVWLTDRVPVAFVAAWR